MLKENLKEPPLYMPTWRHLSIDPATARMVPTFIGSDSEGEVEEISGISKCCLHCGR